MILNILQYPMRQISLYSGLPRSIYILFIVRIVNVMGNFVYPFLTLFLTDRMGMSATGAGTYFIFSAISQAIGALIGGKLTDHFGRKKLIIIFQGLAAVCFVPCAFLGSSILVPVLLILCGLFSGAAQPANSAMVTDLTDKENRAKAFSLLYLGINIGFSIGPMIAGFMYRNYTRWIFFGNAASILISLILLFIFVEETMPDKEKIEKASSINDAEAPEAGGLIRALFKRPVLLMFILVRMINQLIYSTIGFSIPLQLTNVFGNDSGPAYFGIIMSFTGIIVVLFTIPVTKLTMKVRPIINMAVAGMLYGIGFGMMFYMDFLWLYFVAAFIFTLGEILDVTNSGVYVANNSPVTHRGRFNSIITLVATAGSAFGPFVWGMFIDSFGLQKQWIVCFWIGILSCVLMLLLRVFEIKFLIRRQNEQCN